MRPVPARRWSSPRSGLLLGGRADSGRRPHRAPSRPASRAWSRSPTCRPRRCGRGGRRRGRGRPGRAGPQRLRRGSLPGLRRGRLGAGRRAHRGRRALVAVHGQSDQHRLLRPARPARRARPLRRRRRSPRRSQPYAELLPAQLDATERELAEVVATPASAPARPTCCASGSARSRRSPPRPGRTWEPGSAFFRVVLLRWF